MSKPAPRRRIDPRSHKERLAELSATDRQNLYMARLSVEVGTAAQRWLDARGLKATPFCGEYPSHQVVAPHKPTSPQETGTGAGTPPDGGRPLEETNYTPRRVLHF